MDTFRKWLNKPKADDKSLLARFYHADRSLTAVTSELDSFDGRAEPDRCSRLVSRLRQGQDKVLAITNLIMEELLGEDRDPRAFRAKFPEEVLQENLAGQLWFGAECLAAGSSIMNREQESKEMRPLAQAVTRSLGNVRNLLRDQCLRNNVPNSKTLHLDINDSSTEQLYESLKIFDRLFAEFELRYVSAMVPVKTKHEYEMQELISVLFSETLQRALKHGLVDQDKVDAFDPALMFSIPRLAIISGLVIYPQGPLDMNMPSDELSEMFRPFRTILIKIRDLLKSLEQNDLCQLEKLLCTNEDINTRVPVGTSSIEAPCPEQQSATTTEICSNSDGKNSKTCDDDNNQRSNPPTTTNPTEAQVSVTSSLSKVLKHRHHHHHQQQQRYPRSPSISSASANSSIASTPSVSPTPSPTPSNSLASSASSVGATSTTSAADFSDDDDFSDDGGVIDEDDNSDVAHDVIDDELSAPTENADIVAADCASGYLIPNTNFGNLLQPQEVALNGNFIASEDEFSTANEDLQNALNYEAQVNPFLDEDVPTSSSRLRRLQQEQPKINESNNNSHSDNPSTSQPTTTINEKTSGNCRHHHHHHRRSRHHHHHHHHHTHAHHNSHTKLKRCHQGGGSSSSAATLTNDCNVEECSTNADQRRSSTANSPTSPHHHADSASLDSRTSSSSLSDVGDTATASRDTTNLVALRTKSRLRFKSTENLLHRLFVCIAGVADQLQTNFASDLRHILRSVFLMNMSISQDDELDIPEKTKESELFEFRASENDVIQESSNGSNQSIYSAEEVNPELDNVFNNNQNNSNSNNSTGSRSSMSSAESSTNANNQNNNNNHTIRHSTGSSIQRVNTIDLGANEATNLQRNHVERSRSLGDHEQQHDSNASRSLSAYISGRRLSATMTTQNSNNNNNNCAASSTSRQQVALQRHRNNSVGSNSPGSLSNSSSASESNSPISERASNARCLELTNNQQTLNSNTAAPASNNNNNNNSNSNVNTTQIATTTCLAPPAWIPDDRAPRCMSCHAQFTAFRRRHHCRNCGGVFCSVCSNASAPLPKYGLTKAVRVCRECYVREVRGAARTTQPQLATHHQSANTATAGGS